MCAPTGQAVGPHMAILTVDDDPAVSRAQRGLEFIDAYRGIGPGYWSNPQG